MKHIIKTLSLVSALSLVGISAAAHADPGPNAPVAKGRAAAVGAKGHGHQFGKPRAARRAAFIERFDRDGDGKLTGPEKARAQAARQKMKEKRWARLLAKVDLNKDGVITKAEFMAPRKHKKPGQGNPHGHGRGWSGGR